jgi:hypothetical protein
MQLSTLPREPLRAPETLAERLGIDEVGERLLAVDLDHGEQRAVARLELGVPADVDDGEVEGDLCSGVMDDLERTRAEAAVRGVVDGDAARYG